MREPANKRSGQIRSPSGTTFWSFPTEILKDIKIEGHVERRVRWNERVWTRKEDERTLNEVVGYQIASRMGLPLQPWLAFESPAPRSTGVGMFIEWWTPAHLQSSLVGLGAEHAALVARGLAFWVFGRDEWPEWLLSENTSDLRLIDLDGTGPLLTVPPHEALLRNYLNATKSVFCKARSEADLRGITNGFNAEIHRLLAVDFSGVVDLSGHPSASALTKTMLSGLQTRQRELGKLLRAD